MARSSRKFASLAGVVLAVGVFAACSSSHKTSGTSGTAGASGTPSTSGASKPSVTFGAENFPENDVLAYVYSDALKRAGFPSSVKPNLGSREVIEPALEHGDFDATVEYVGNYLAYLDPKVGNLSVPATVSTLAPIVAQRGLALGQVSQAADSDAVAVKQSTANQYHLASIADLAPYAPKWSFGGPPECATRITCIPGLEQFYGVKFKSFRSLDEDGPITHTALADGSVQAARIFSSDAVIAQDHFVVLTDPKDFQGAGNIIPVIRAGKATTQVLNVLNQVSAAITTADLVQFNLAVGVNHVDPATVASQYVDSHNLG
jgi:osmoprotectant transport system substrate-binding protein